MVLVAAPTAAQGPPACPAAAALSGAVAPAVMEAAVACFVDAERLARRLAPLRSSGPLALSARRHARDMVTRRYFAHESPGGGTVGRRARRAGYLTAPCWVLGEDLGAAPAAVASAEAVVAAWMESPSHRSVILDPAFREIGVAVVDGTPTGESGATFVLELGVVRCARAGVRALPRVRAG